MMASRIAAVFMFLFAGVGVWRSFEAVSPVGYAVAAVFLAVGVLLWTRGVYRPAPARAGRAER